MQRYEIHLIADYHQFYLQDDDARFGDLSSAWTDEASERGLAEVPHAIGVATGVDAEVAVTIEVHDAPPELPAHPCERVNVAELAIDTGRVVVAGGAESLPDAFRIVVRPGRYEAIICHGERYLVLLYPKRAQAPARIDESSEKDELKAAIRAAFAGTEYPGDWCLRGSNEGDEPYLLEEEFRGRNDWAALDAAFLDRAPDGFGTSLSFFSDEAFRFYLPAYLIADIDGALQQQDPVFHLTYGLDDESRGRKINPRRYGERTWIDAKRYKFAMLSAREVAAIVRYLEFRARTDDIARPRIEQALRNYWAGAMTR